MREDDKYYTELDLQLQNLAAIDWPAFVQLIGEDAITAAKICILKSKGRSLNQIANRLTITKRKAQVNCDKCPTSPKT
jgi:hypothetical protein